MLVSKYLDAKARSLQLITRNQEEAIGNAADTLEPLFDMCKGVYVVRGTEAHVGQQAQAEEALARNFDNSIPSDTGSHSWDWLPLDVEGVRLDVCHHPRGAGNGRPMNNQSGIDRIASDTLFQYANDGQTPPALVIRSHLHGYRDSENAFRTRAIITPAMSLLTGYARRIGINVSLSGKPSATVKNFISILNFDPSLLPESSFYYKFIQSICCSNP